MPLKDLSARQESAAHARTKIDRQRPYRDKTNQLRRVYEMQDVMFDGVMNAETWADKVSASRAWRELELLRRLILGKPSTVAAEQPSKRNPGSMSQMPKDLDMDKAA